MNNSQSIKPGDRLGGFLVTQELGSGGMGRVWKALDEPLSRHVAIKVLHSRYLDDDLMLRRFRREPLAMSRVKHPNVPQVLSLHEEPGLVYFVMEYIDGRKLGDMITDEYRLPLLRAMDVFRQTAAALEAVHEAGVIHRDIKPGNIMADTRGRAVLADFGLAKTDTWSSRAGKPFDPSTALREFDAQDTPHKGLTGTPAYLAPERWLGRDYDHRVDIYSFGVMMFHTLTGELPFGEEASHETMAGHVKGRARSVSSIAGPVPELIERITARCMEKAPEQRFQSAGELFKALNFAEKDVDVGRGKIQKKLDGLELSIEAPRELDSVRNAARAIGIILIVALLLFVLIILPMMALNLKVKIEKKEIPGMKTNTSAPAGNAVPEKQ